MLIPLPLVLILDDDDFNLAAFSKGLSRMSYQVLTAHHGQEALDLYADRLAAGEIQAIITDVDMNPGMSGPDFVAEIRKRWPQLCIPVLFVTGSGSGVQHLRAAGEQVLTKPVRIQQLLEALVGMIKPIPTIPPPPNRPGDTDA